MHRFISWPQIVMWHNSARASGPLCVLKQVEHTLGLIYEIKPSGQHKLAGSLEVKRKETMSIFAKLDAYWDSDQCVVDEYEQLKTDHLVILRDNNAACLEAMDRFKDDEPKYWQWRVEFGLADVSCRKPLSKCRSVSEKLLRCAKIVLARRGVN